MVAWDMRQLEGPSSSGLTALAVYLIACHHGKVRTVLRANPLRKRKGGGFIQSKKTDLMFGIRSGDELLPVSDVLPDRTGHIHRASPLRNERDMGRRR